MLSFSVLTFILLLSFMQMPSLVQQQRMEVEQLRRAAAMKRIPVSQAVEDIKVREDKGRNIGKISERRFLSQYCRSDSLCDNFHVFLRPSPFIHQPRMQRYTAEHMGQDHLIVGFASEKANPFREKTWSCDLL